MVWGLFESNGFGKYRPEADFIDWNSRLEAYFNNVLTEEQRQSFCNDIASFRYEAARKFSIESDPLEEHEQPRHLQFDKSYKDLASIIELPNRLLAVDETLKNIIESLEPDVHQFWPIQMTMPRDKDHPVPYYGMVIRQVFDSFDPEQTSEDVFSGSGSYEKRHYSVHGSAKAEAGQLAMKKDVFNGAHLWRERRLWNPDYFISNALKDKVDAAGLRIFKHHQLKVV